MLFPRGSFRGEPSRHPSPMDSGEKGDTGGEAQGSRMWWCLMYRDQVAMSLRCDIVPNVIAFPFNRESCERARKDYRRPQLTVPAQPTEHRVEVRHRLGGDLEDCASFAAQFVHLQHFRVVGGAEGVQQASPVVAAQLHQRGHWQPNLRGVNLRTIAEDDTRVLHASHALSHGGRRQTDAAGQLVV